MSGCFTPLLSLLLVAFFTSCQRNKVHSESSVAFRNPIDNILGEKVLKEAGKPIRKSNFHLFAKIREKELNAPSLLYDIKGQEHTYAINQKKTYSHARPFSAILRTNETDTNSYMIIEDLQIIDFVVLQHECYVLAGNFGVYSSMWKKENELQLIKLNKELKQIWSYQIVPQYSPIEGLDIAKSNSNIVLNVLLKAECHECSNAFEVTVNDLGQCISAIETGKINTSRNFSPEEIDTLFIINH